MNYLPYFHICAVCVNCDVILFNQSTRTQLKSIRSIVHFAECFYDAVSLTVFTGYVWTESQ